MKNGSFTVPGPVLQHANTFIVLYSNFSVSYILSVGKNQTNAFQLLYFDLKI